MADPSANDNAKGVANATGDETKEKSRGKMTATEEKSGNSTNKKKTSAASKVTAQLQQMKDANTKYKSLLKMAKDRIEQQEAELKKLKGEKERVYRRWFWRPPKFIGAVLVSCPVQA